MHSLQCNCAYFQKMKRQCCLVTCDSSGPPTLSWATQKPLKSEVEFLQNRLRSFHQEAIFHGATVTSKWGIYVGTSVPFQSNGFHDYKIARSWSGAAVHRVTWCNLGKESPLISSEFLKWWLSSLISRSSVSLTDEASTCGWARQSHLLAGNGSASSSSLSTLPSSSSLLFSSSSSTCRAPPCGILLPPPHCLRCLHSSLSGASASMPTATCAQICSLVNAK